MRVEVIEKAIHITEEIQSNTVYSHKSSENIKVRNVLSLFSGCGGMDLGFEGGFSVLSSSVNETLTPHFIDEKYQNGFIKLKKQNSKLFLQTTFLKMPKMPG